MQAEIAKTLIQALKNDGKDINKKGGFCTEEALLANRLKRSFGNAYDFDQTERGIQSL